MLVLANTAVVADIFTVVWRMRLLLVRAVAGKRFDASHDAAELDGTELNCCC